MLVGVQGETQYIDGPAGTTSTLFFPRANSILYYQPHLSEYKSPVPLVDNLNFFPISIDCNEKLVLVGGQKGQFALVKHGIFENGTTNELLMMSTIGTSINNSVKIIQYGSVLNLLFCNNDNRLRIFDDQMRLVQELKHDWPVNYCAVSGEQNDLYQEYVNKLLIGTDGINNQHTDGLGDSDNRACSEDRTGSDNRPGSEDTYASNNRSDHKYDWPDTKQYGNKDEMNHPKQTSSKYLVTVGDTPYFNLYSYGQTTTLIDTFKLHTDGGFKVVWHTNGNNFAICTQDGWCYIWDVRMMDRNMDRKSMGCMGTGPRGRCCKSMDRNNTHTDNTHSESMQDGSDSHNAYSNKGPSPKSKERRIDFTRLTHPVSHFIVRPGLTVETFNRQAIDEGDLSNLKGIISRDPPPYEEQSESNSELNMDSEPDTIMRGSDSELNKDSEPTCEPLNIEPVTDSHMETPLSNCESPHIAHDEYIPITFHSTQPGLKGAIRNVIFHGDMLIFSEHTDKIQMIDLKGVLDQRLFRMGHGLENMGTSHGSIISSIVSHTTCSIPIDHTLNYYPFLRTQPLTISNTQITGMAILDGALFVASGDGIYEWNIDGDYTYSWGY